MRARVLDLFAAAIAVSLAMPANVVLADAPGEPFLSFEAALDQLPSTPSVSTGAPAALGNPAAWSLTGPVAETAFWFNDRGLDGGPRNWGLSLGRTLGFAMERNVFAGAGGAAVVDYALGASFGDRAHHVGLAWRWSGGAEERVGREHGFAFGAITRPNRFLSYGSSVLLSTESSARIGIIDLGVRPLGTPLATLFGAFSLRNRESFDEGRWRAGLELRPWRGIHVGGTYDDGPGDDDERFGVSFGLTLDQLATHVLPRYDDSGDRLATTTVIRHAPPYRGVPVARWLRAHTGPRRYVSFDLDGRTLSHQRYRFFDSENVAWIDLSRALDRALDDPGVHGVALDLTGFQCRAALGWELRQKLEAIKARGKEVIVHADRLTFVGYYVASVADRLTLDPEGLVLLPGLAAHRTYMHETLEKLGIGFQELRFFTHKTADESFSRSDMSEADREQYQRMLDLFYEEVRSAVSRDRHLTPAEFDARVDEDVALPASMALERGLVDGLSRWHELPKWLEEERDGAHLVPMPRDLDREPKPDERWGLPRRIAVVNAIGVCAMDTGIRGRATSSYLRSLEKRRDVVGVVLRADSPGGDPLPSDLVAGATRSLRERGKPVVVSQSGVAASGGYWISMDGTRVLTTPFTVTGSIGVIGGWVWDNGLGTKTGFSSDGVQRGKHADLFTGTRFPFVPSPLPTRPLTGEEVSIVESRFRQLYDRFVARVAAGRSIPEDEVRRIGEGRVWIGRDAIDLRLCDGIGSLDDAIASVKENAGLRADEEVELIEYPRRKLFRMPTLGPSLLGALPGAGLLSGGLGRLTGGAGDAGASPRPDEDPAPEDARYLEALLGSPGTPQLLIAPEELPAEWRNPE